MTRHGDGPGSYQPPGPSNPRQERGSNTMHDQSNADHRQGTPKTSDGWHWDSWWAGYERGHNRGVQVGQQYIDPRLIEERALELIAGWREDTRAAGRHQAQANHGPGWADLIEYGGDTA